MELALVPNICQSIANKDGAKHNWEVYADSLESRRCSHERSSPVEVEVIVILR